MTVFVLFQGLTAAQVLPVWQAGAIGANLPPGSQFIDLRSGGAGNPVVGPTNQVFQVNVDAASPGVTVSATVQILASNDGFHWIGYGSPITVASGPAPGMGSLAQTSMFGFYSAYLQAVSGTGAKVATLMNA